MENKKIIKEGDIQSMTAGTGVSHSEYNKNKDKEVRFLQIWILPKVKNVTPLYDQITLNLEDHHNKLQQIVSPYTEEEGVTINQDAWFYMGDLDTDTTLSYKLKDLDTGVYAFILEGDVCINNEKLSKRDGLGISNTEELFIRSESNSKILLMEVPMRF